MVYFFDIEKCKCCPYQWGCYKEGAKNENYTQKQSFAIPTVNRLNFRKLSISNEKMRDAIK